ncbi:hypothetical protein NPIL_46791, partial [Nephila pilipes]
EEKYVKKPEKEIIERSHSFSSRWNECREENSRSRLSQHLVDRQKFSDDSTSDSDDSHSRRSSAKRRSVFAYSRSITPDWYSSQNDSEQDSREYGSENENHFSRTFYCEICQLQLNSELTYQSHMNGKKHQKLLHILLQLGDKGFLVHFDGRWVEEFSWQLDVGAIHHLGN